MPASSIQRAAIIVLSVAAALLASAPPPLAAPLAESTASAACFPELAERGITGGQLAGVLPASVERVEALLLDFDRASGHRAWFRRSRLMRREADRVVARWEMEGRLGIHPTVTLEFDVERRPDVTLISFRLKRRTFGLAVFSGCYRLERLAHLPPSSRMTQTVYIDSGLPFVGPSDEDIATGLREDLDFLREWLEEVQAFQPSPLPPD